LTDVGKVVLRYADEIFSLGGELLEAVQGRSTGKPMRLDVGIVDVLPKLVVRRLLEPALTLPEPVHLVCHEGAFDRLLGDLSQHALDIVIADSPVPSGSMVRAHNHQLGECGVSFFATASLAHIYQKGFPGSLDGAPVLLPTENMTLRRSLNQWFEKHGIRPRVVAEFEDSALLKVFGADGVGIFPAPAAAEKDVEAQYGVLHLGQAEGVIERFYAISVERRLKNPAILAISRAAHHEVFASRASGVRRG
jgi:LysR family transcriptional regulator, transcriptional activator of nhaA